MTFACPNLDDYETVDSIVEFALSLVGEHFDAGSEEHELTQQDLENILKKLQKYRQPGKKWPHSEFVEIDVQSTKK